MSAAIEQAIIDFHHRSLPKVYHREHSLALIPGKIDAIIGMRRSGKTWLLYQTIQGLMQKASLPIERFLYINFENEQLLPLETGDLQKIIESYYRLYPDHKNTLCYFFFDEIQNVPHWEQFLRRLLDQENVQIAVTGSSAKLLSTEIATSLRGRALTTECFPFSFIEYLSYLGGQYQPAALISSEKKAYLEQASRRYLEHGGFPETLSVQAEYQYQILQSYVDVVLFRDIIERYQLSQITSLRYLVRHLLSAPASLFSVNKFYKDLKSQGVVCSKDTLYQLLAHLQDAYLLHAVSIYSHSERAKQVNPKKMYIVDNGLIEAFRSRPEMALGALLENFVYLELRRHYHEICYYRTSQGHEVDFLVSKRRETPKLIQVSVDVDNKDTLARELRALEEAMVEMDLPTALLVTLNTEGMIQRGDKEVQLVPAWQFAVTLQKI